MMCIFTIPILEVLEPKSIDQSSEQYPVLPEICKIPGLDFPGVPSFYIYARVCGWEGGCRDRSILHGVGTHLFAPLYGPCAMERN